MSDFAQTVKQQADIVKVIEGYIRLRKAGRAELLGPVPVPQGEIAVVLVHAVRQFYHCFGCRASGDVFSFVGKIENVGFPEAVRIVAQKCGIPLPKREFSSPEEAAEARMRAKLLDLHEAATAWFEEQLRGPEGAVAREYLAGRGLDAGGNQEIPHRLRAGQLQRPARPAERHGRRRDAARQRPVQLQGAGRRQRRATSTTASASASCFPSPTRAAA